VTCAVNPVHEDHGPTGHDKDIVQIGRFISHEMEGRLQIYHSYYSILNLPSSAYSWSGQFGVVFTEEADQKIRQSHTQALYKLADEFSIEHDKIIMEDGETRYCLPKFVSKSNTDLLVIGATTKSRFEQVFIGGTAEDILDEVECDILVLHSADFESPMKTKHPTLIR
jgi:universal stress protein E